MAAKEDWSLRASMCELLALGFTCPGDVLLGALATADYAAAATELAQGLNLPISEEQLAGLAQQAAAPHASASAAHNRADTPSSEETNSPDGADTREALRAEYTRLFIGAPLPLVDPYEGTRDARAKHAKALVYLNARCADAEHFCRSCGLAPEGTEPLDHIASELEVLEYLAAAEAGFAELPEGFTPATFPGGSAGNAYLLFLKDHLTPWVSSFCADVDQHAAEPFYRSLSELLNVFIAHESK